MRRCEESVHAAAPVLLLQHKSDSAAQPSGVAAQNELISVAFAWMKLCHEVTNLAPRVCEEPSEPITPSQSCRVPVGSG